VHPVCGLLTPARFAPTLDGVDAQLTADQGAFFRLALETGRLRREEEAVEEGLPMWVEG